jgi:putative DNA primase/helicase
LAGRFIVLRLQESFYGREDTTLTDALLKEREGVLLWAIEGWRRLRERGRFVQPESGAEMREAMDDLSSPVLAFIRDCCMVGDVYTVRIPDIYAAWQEWCKASGRDTTTTEQTFGRDLRAAVPRLRGGQHREGADRCRVYHGITLK